MARYKVIFDTSYGNVSSYEEIIIEADTAAKAKYKVSQIENIEFGIFLKYFRPDVYKVSENTPLTHKKYSNDNPTREMQLEWEWVRLYAGALKEG